MYFIFLGITVVLGSVSAALAYLWYRSDGESDRRLLQRRRQQYLAEARLDLLEKPLVGSPVRVAPEFGDSSRKEGKGETGPSPA